MSWAEAVKQLRKAHTWTQDDLAEATGLNQGTIANIERGRHENPTDRIQGLLAAAFGITVTQLRRAAGRASTLEDLQADGVDSEFIQILREMEPDLSPEARQALITTAQQMRRRASRRNEKQRQRRAVPPAEPEQPPE